MCEYVSGELLLCFARVDPAGRQLIDDIKRGDIEHVQYIESMEDRLARLDRRPNLELEFEFHRVSVPPDQELWKITYLQFFYRNKFIYAYIDALNRRSQGHATQEDDDFLDKMRYSDSQFTATTNSLLTLTTGQLGTAPVQASKFTFSSFHSQYKSFINTPAIPTDELGQVRIAVIDSGIADDANIRIIAKTNFVDSKQPTTGRFITPQVPQKLDFERSAIVTDENGHGTVVALILHDLAPTAQFIICKVADAEGRASEWDTLAALATCAPAHIVNISLQFGLKDRICNVCGRESGSSRSTVFENILSQFDRLQQRPFLVAAAGNNSSSDLAFPARFSNAVAIGSINSQRQLSSESNYGIQLNGTSENCFVLPGGDDMTIPPETIGNFGRKDNLLWHGTSFATAYASGAIANLIADQGSDLPYDALLAHLKILANSEVLANNSEGKYGQGLIQL